MGLNVDTASLAYRHRAIMVYSEKLINIIAFSDSFTIFGLWVLGLAVSNINESQLLTYEP